MPQSYLFMRVPKDFITQNDHLAQLFKNGNQQSSQSYCYYYKNCELNCGTSAPHD